MKLHPHALLLAIAFALFTPLPNQAAEVLPALVKALASTPDPQIQLDILRGLRDATQGRPSLPMPAGWDAAETRLVRSDVPEIRSLTTSLGLTFGSQSALASLRATLGDRKADTAQRQEALRALLGIRDSSLPPTLRELLQDPALRGSAARALATFDDPATPTALLAVYSSLAGGERRDALNTLASRPAYARAMLGAVAAGTVPSKDLTAELIRQLRNLKDEPINSALTQVYGAIREVSADKQAEIERYKRLYRAGGSTPGNAIRGRAAFAKVCQQCHTLFDVGGKVGPDLTGSNRGDLDYILQNILDPNAVIPNEYRASTLEMKDGRVVTGIIRQQDDRSVVVATANETVRLPRADITESSQSQLSMMPEGLLAPLAEQEFRDLIYYLASPSQSPMLATPETANLFFNAADLSLWQGDDTTWSVANGEIVARSASVLAGNRHLRSDLVAGDFRLVLQFQFRTPNAVSGGIALRSEPTPDGGVRGYWIGLTPDSWNALAEEGGRGVLQKAQPNAPKARDGWNTLEILAVGDRIRTAVNGEAGIDFADPAGARQGLVALRLPTGGTADARFKELRFEVNPKAELTTLRH